MRDRFAMPVNQQLGYSLKESLMHLKTDPCRPDEVFVKLRKTGAGDHSIRILIVDDCEIFRKALWLLLLTDPLFSLVGMACDGLESIGKVEKLRPDIVIMDSVMPVMDGVEATRMITTRFPRTLVIGLSSVDTHAAREAMINAGATDFFGKIEALNTLMPAIQRHIAARDQLKSEGALHVVTALFSK